uniref:Uncharacterized protein n=1 Tax=Glossina morsitans morsitans TaxID=37546 RepID=A0A1B0G4E3_GLOMM
MIYWFYNVTPPMLTYAALAWCPKVKQKTPTTTLNKTKRLACIGINGVMRFCPLNALEAVQNSLFMTTEKQAFRSATRLLNIDKLNPGNLRGLEVSKNFLDKLFVKIPSRPLPRHASIIRFTVTMLSCSHWNEPTFEPRPQENGTPMIKNWKIPKLGLGYMVRFFKRSKCCKPSIFHAETYAITGCASECLRRQCRKELMCVYFDSQAAIKA